MLLKLFIVRMKNVNAADAEMHAFLHRHGMLAVEEECVAASS